MTYRMKPSAASRARRLDRERKEREAAAAFEYRKANPSIAQRIAAVHKKTLRGGTT